MAIITGTVKQDRHDMCKQAGRPRRQWKVLSWAFSPFGKCLLATPKRPNQGLGSLKMHCNHRPALPSGGPPAAPTSNLGLFELRCLLYRHLPQPDTAGKR